jgi:hypothetical protein
MCPDKALDSHHGSLCAGLAPANIEVDRVDERHIATRRPPFADTQHVSIFIVVPRQLARRSRSPTVKIVTACVHLLHASTVTLPFLAVSRGHEESALQHDGAHGIWIDEA